MAEQSGLAGPRVVAKHQELALTQPHSGDQPVERLGFLPAIDEARRRETGDRHPGRIITVRATRLGRVFSRVASLVAAAAWWPNR